MNSSPPARAPAPRERSTSARRAWSSDETRSTPHMIAAHRRVSRSTPPRLPSSRGRVSHGPGRNARHLGRLRILQAVSSKRTVLAQGLCVVAAKNSHTKSLRFGKLTCSPITNDGNGIGSAPAQWCPSPSISYHTSCAVPPHCDQALACTPFAGAPVVLGFWHPSRAAQPFAVSS